VSFIRRGQDLITIEQEYYALSLVLYLEKENKLFSDWLTDYAFNKLFSDWIRPYRGYIRKKF
jgi:hypothetical protein